MEGSRPILAEVQGLVATSNYGNARRTATGFDYNRMSMLLAVLEKRAGYFFGKHKLCPKISPKKTIEGSIGGTLGTMLVSGLFGHFVMPQLMVHCMIMGALGAVFSQFGDLTASIFKRKMGIKDYGNLIPGHGGILDRFDSVLFTAPLIYYYIIFVLA